MIDKINGTAFNGGKFFLYLLDRFMFCPHPLLPSYSPKGYYQNTWNKASCKFWYVCVLFICFLLHCEELELK